MTEPFSRELALIRRDLDPGDDTVTRTAGRGVATILLFSGAFAAGVSAAFAQMPLTLEEAMKRARGATADARALASTFDEADARVRQAQ